MKIGLLNPYLTTSGMGGYAFELFRALRKRMKNKVGEKTENEIEMVFLDFKNFGSNLPREEGVVVKTSPVHLPVAARMFNRFLYFNRRIYDDYDITHLANQNLSSLIPKVNNPIITCHDLLPITVPGNHSKYYVWLYARAVKNMRDAEAVLTNSQHTKNTVHKILKIPEDRMTVTYYGINHSIFKPMKKEKIRKELGLGLDEKILIHVGTEEYRKNVHTLLKVFAGLVNEYRNLKLIRIGERSKSNERLVRRFGLEDNVSYLGIAQPEMIAKYYNASDLLVFPSLAEGFGRPPVEAMACGLPTVVTNTTSLPEITGNASVLFNPYDAKEMKEKIRTVLDDKALQRKLRTKGMRQAKKFTWEKCAKDTMKVYEEVS